MPPKKPNAPRAGDCHVIGHAWFPLPVDPAYLPPWGVPLWLGCQRCGGERHDLVGRSGQILTRVYHYAPGYLYDPTERVPRDEARGHMLAELGLDVAKAADRPPLVARRPIATPTPSTVPRTSRRPVGRHPKAKAKVTT